jgi:CRISPR-associated exonuclease Cas4
MIPILALVLTVLALLLLWQASRQRKAAGLPGGRVIYADTRAWGAVEKPLYDADLGLAGKPDYLVQRGSAIIPVEVKSSRVGAAPHDSHIYQLGAYCLLVQRTTGKRPPYGILHYPNRTFAIDYTPALETALLDLLTEMRRLERKGDAPRSHEQPARCARCGFRSDCDQRLA